MLSDEDRAEVERITTMFPGGLMSRLEAERAVTYANLCESETRRQTLEAENTALHEQAQQAHELLQEVALQADTTPDAVPSEYVRMNLQRLGRRARALLNEE